MHKLPIREMKNILEQRIDYNSAITQQAMNRLGLTQRSLQRMSYLEYMTTSTSQQDYFLYLHAIAINIKKLHQEIAKMSLKDKSIDCTDPGNIDEIIAVLDQRMNHTHTQDRQNTQEKDNNNKRIIKFTKSGIKSITERTLIQQQKQNSLSPDRIQNNNKQQNKFIISNNQSVAEIKHDEQLNDSIRKPDKVLSGIRNRLKENNCSKQAIDDFMKRISKLRSVSQQSIDSGRKVLPGTIIKLKKTPGIISTKLELMLKREKLIREEPLKIHQLKIGSIMGVISKIRNQKSKEKMFQQLNL